MMPTAIETNLQAIREKIARAAERAGRNPAEISLVAVTKTCSPEVIQAAYVAGLRDFGENRLQEAIPKIEALRHLTNLRWHMIGHLQSNKARKCADYFHMIQSVDTFELAQRLSLHGAQTNRPIRILIEVNTSGEATKFGYPTEKLLDEIGRLADLPHLQIAGLMTIGPLTQDERRVRQAFIVLRELFGKIRSRPGLSEEFKILSMGMTDDFELAIAEGSNMLRIGRGLFGERWMS